MRWGVPQIKYDHIKIAVDQVHEEQKYRENKYKIRKNTKISRGMPPDEATSTGKGDPRFHQKDTDGSHTILVQKLSLRFHT